MNVKGRLLALLIVSSNIAIGYFIYMSAVETGGGMTARIWTAWALLLATAGIGWLLGAGWDAARRCAHRDELTGVYSRRFMSDFIRKLLGKVGKHNKKITVSLIDLDHFKKVNDTCGHHAGDELLQQVSGILSKCSVKGELVARWGGDEFVMVCPYADREATARLTESIGTRLEQLSQEKKISITVSIGFAVFPDDGLTMPELLEAADRNMYESKNKQRNWERVVQHKQNLIG